MMEGIEEEPLIDEETMRFIITTLGEIYRNSKDKKSSTQAYGALCEIEEYTRKLITKRMEVEN